MNINTKYELTDSKRFFLEPSNSAQRQYEALRAFFVEGLPSAEAAKRFGYTPGSFRVLVHDFRHDPAPKFFISPQRGPDSAPKTDPLREKIINLRKQNFSIYDIRDLLQEEGHSLGSSTISAILKQEGFSKLPRRGDDERRDVPRPLPADATKVQLLNLKPRMLRTKFGGLFLFLPLLAKIPLDEILKKADFPGSKKIPADHAMRSLLALKLFGHSRHSHVMSYVFDEGLALWAGLNVIPKQAFLTQYSCRVTPSSYPSLMKLWFDEVGKLGLERGVSFNLDFHTIPFHGEDALLEKHYVSKRSRRQKGILAFIAQEEENQVFCYTNADLRKEEQNDEVLRFVEFWKERTGKAPEELIFDSRLTTYANLDKLNEMNIKFMTLRRRTQKLLDKLHELPLSAWRRIELENIARAYKTPWIYDEEISLKGYSQPIRQIAVKDLGHEEPTILLTNYLSTSPVKLIGRYAKRMLVENGISDAIEFFHMDALSSAVAMKVNCDLMLTMMATSLYRLLGVRIGRGYGTARSNHIFRDFIDATATIDLTEQEVVVKFQKRAHNPLLLAAGFDKESLPIPWLQNKTLRLVFG
jgi:transposase